MEKRYITVGTLNRYLKNKFDTDPNIQRVYLKGEISNFKGHTRGHLYFTLKDEESRISAVMFSYNTSKLTFVPEDGMKVLVEGKVTVYPATGAYQIYVDDMTSDGLGNLYIKYEALKKELGQKGLFNPEIKKNIPKYPQRIGIITAPTGAAIKDILSTIKRRYPICETILFPSLVQGEFAKDEIVKQIKEADKYNLDVLIVGRGGGSIEDLWAFNEEVVAYAIYEANTPIISAVGHEIDFTIADFVADLRAPTPTGAAEMAVPNISDLKTLLNQYEIRLTNIINNKIKGYFDKLNYYKDSYVLKNPLAIYELKEQKLSNIITNLNNLVIKKLDLAGAKYQNLKDNYILNHPLELIKNASNTLTLNIKKLELLNPLSILSKGYSVVKKDGNIINNIDCVNVNDLINIKLYNGELLAKVEKVENNGK